MMIYALGTGSIPFNDCSNEFAAAFAAQQGQRPAKPLCLGGLNADATDTLWDNVTRMWIQTPAFRPSMLTVRDSISELFLSL